MHMLKTDIVQKLFELDDSISYVAVLEGSNTILECRFRDEAKAESSGRIMKEFVSISPLVMLGTVGRLREVFGNATYLMVKFEGQLVAICEVKNLIVLFVLDGTDADRVDKIYGTMKTWSFT
jgi:hypothetical protein